MRYPTPLPQALRGAPLTVRSLRQHGVAESRLQREDIIKLGSGIFLERYVAEALGADGLFRVRARGLVHEFPGSWLSHTTAARLRGFPLLTVPEDVVHLSAPGTMSNPVRRKGVTGHKAAARPGEVLEVEGLPMSAAPRMWLECAGQLSPQALVVLGDSLVRRPRLRFEGRSVPHARADDLREVIGRHARAPGRAKARAALELIRVGADSAQETLLRLAVRRAGLPEPELQVPVNPDRSTSPCADLGYRRWRIAIQYDGAWHFDAERAKSDRRVDRLFRSHGWTVLRYVDADARQGFTGAVQEIAQTIDHQRRV